MERTRGYGPRGVGSIPTVSTLLKKGGKSMETQNDGLQKLRDKIEKVRTIVSNLNSFKDGDFEAYRLEEPERVLTEEGLSYYLSMLQSTLEALEGDT